MEDEMSMSIKEIARLIDWLKANGHTDAEVTECIKFIAGTEEPKQAPSK